MANKRFIKPIRPNVTITPVVDITQTVKDNRDAICRDEYRYCLAEAKRQHPDWTLAQRQAYARNVAQSLFD